MKKILIIFPVLLMILLSGCLKDKPNVDFSKIGPVAEITTSNINPTPNAPSGGLAFFSKANLSFSGAPDPDTVWFTVNIASDYPLNKDVAITVAVDPTALSNYNADSVHNSPYVNFAIFPDSTFTFANTSGTVHAGQRLDTFYVVFYPSKIDPTVSYLLPISIKSATGVTISGNLGTIYYHQIGNPIAGGYTHEWIRYNNAAGTGAPSFDDVYSDVFSPLNSTSISVYSNTGTLYILSFTNIGGVLSNFQVTFDPASVKTAGITITGGPTIIVANPVTRQYQFNFTYLNSFGSARNITDKFY